MIVVSRHLVEPAHHVPLELRLVLAGRLPAVAPGGGHVLAHRVPVWVYSIVFFLVFSGECVLCPYIPTFLLWSWPGMHWSAHLCATTASSSSHTSSLCVEE